MGAISVEDIRGYCVGSEIVCSDCVTDEEVRLAKESEIILADEVEKLECDFIHFCDRCKSRI